MDSGLVPDGQLVVARGDRPVALDPVDRIPRRGVLFVQLRVARQGLA